MSTGLTISWSSLKRHEDCRQSALLVGTGGRPPTADIRVFLPGTVADAVIRTWLKQDEPKPGQMEKIASTVLEMYATPASQGGLGDGVVNWRGPNDKALVLNFVRELCRRIEPWLMKHVIPYDYDYGIRFKVPIQIPYLSGVLTTVNLAGEIDLLVRPKDRFRGYDVKGTRNPDYVNTVLGQAIFYDVAMNAMYGAPCEEWGFIQPMVDTAFFVPVRITPQDRATMVSRITRMATYMWQRDWSPKPDNKGCNKCEVKHGCVKYKPSVGSDGKKRLSLAPSSE